MKKFTKEEINSFTEEETKRFIIAYGDGEGDTYLSTLYEENGEADINSTREDVYTDTLYYIYDDNGGANMVKIAWIDNNTIVEVDIISDITPGSPPTPQGINF